jgi:hypothetical protein
MVAWRVDAQRVHIGQGIRLLFSPTDGVIAAGDTLQIVYPNHEQRQGTVITALPADTVMRCLSVALLLSFPLRCLLCRT